MSTFGPIATSGTTTTFLPLTTAFSAPSACSSLFLINTDAPPQAGHDFHLYAFDIKYASVAGGGPTCQDEDIISWWDQNSNETTTTTQLGGYNMDCPAAYSTVFSLAQNTQVTTIGCCPSSYTFVSLMSEPFPGQCYTVIPAGVITYLQPGSETSVIPWTTTSSTFSSPYSLFAVQVNGYIYPNPAGTATTTTPGSAASTSNTLSSATSSSSTSSIPSASSSTGLSTGAKAGIGVAVALGVLGLAALFGAWVLIRRKRQAYTVPPAYKAFQPQDVMEKTTQRHPFEMSADTHHTAELP